MRFKILGPLCVEVGESEVPVAGTRDRTVLAVLLLDANHVVPVDRLVDAVWPRQPPATARVQIQNCVSRLRRLRQSDPAGGEAIHSFGSGYRIEATEETLDALAFTQTVAVAREAAAADEWEQASGLYRAALRLWRGEALSGIDSETVRVGAAGWDEQRLTVLEERFNAELRLGRAAQVIGELAALVGRHPLRERLRGFLMLALYQLGRQAEALTVYRQGRQALAEQLGIEPGEELADLHRRILNRDPGLRPGLPGASARHAVSTLPRDIPDFTGRDAALARVHGLLLGPDEDGAGGSPIVAIDGMAGTGKTTLALHVAHQLVERFPDAQLYLDLHGHSERSPIEPVAALDALLRQLGVPGERIATTLQERVGMWHHELSGRRGLLVLDNAASSAQVMPLLPTGPGWGTLITSRRRLLGLAGAHILSLELFTDEESLAFLGRVAGQRVSAAPQQAGEVVRLCGNLALALRLAAARLVHRPTWQVSDLAYRLRHTNLLHQNITDETHGVAHAFTLSYQHLTPAAQRVFRLLGLHPGPDLDCHTAAALADLDDAATRAVLDELVDAHLLQEPVPDRYRLHDLIRGYAHDLAHTTLTSAERDAALRREVSYYLHSTRNAVAHFLNAPRPPWWHTTTSEASALSFAEPVVADRWLHTEYPNVVSLIRACARRAWHLPTCELTNAIWYHQYRAGHNDDCLEIHQLALTAAQTLGDALHTALAYNHRASIHFRHGQLEQALHDTRKALEYLTDIPAVRAGTLANVSIVLRNLGRFTQARNAALEAAKIYENLGDHAQVVIARCGAADVGVDQGHYHESLRVYRDLLRMGRQTGLDVPVIQAFAEIGEVQLRRGNYRAAISLLNRALRHRHLLVHPTLALALSHLAAAHRELGDLDQALRLHSEALDLVHQFADTLAESRIRTELAATLHAAGDHTTALDQYQQALALANHIGARLLRARALHGIATTLAATHDPAAAGYQQQAQQMYQECEIPQPATHTEAT